jgi:hypothetical protein
MVCATTPLNTITRHFLLPPEESVYSYFHFLPPIDQLRTKRYITPLIIFAATLVAVNFVMQSGLLFVVGRYIMSEHVRWVETLVHLKYHAWYHIIEMPYNEAPPRCHGKRSSLCWEHGGGDGIACAPKSVEALSRWQLLDKDGDGVWSRTESRDEDLAEVFQCDYNVDLPLMYDTIVHHLNRSHMLRKRRDSNLFSGEAVHKAYFNWFLHKPVLCMYGDADMCGSLFHKGFFDEALLQQPSPVFKDVASALKYCNKLLREECFDILPNTYRVWRFVSSQQCGEKIYGQSVFHSPAASEDSDPDSDLVSMPIVSVDYKKYEEYQSTKTIQWRLFLCILLVTFLSVMAEEARSIFKVVCWTITFPRDEDGDRGIVNSAGEKCIVGPEAVEIEHREREDFRIEEDTPAYIDYIEGTLYNADVRGSNEIETEDQAQAECSEEEKCLGYLEQSRGGFCLLYPGDTFYSAGKPGSWVKSVKVKTQASREVTRQCIYQTRTDHRIAVLIVTIFRYGLWIFLLWSGIMFLTGRPRYLSLIFDALSLVFIFEIDEVLYRTMLRLEFKNDHALIEPLQVQHVHRWVQGLECVRSKPSLQAVASKFNWIEGDHAVVFDMCVLFVIIGAAVFVVYTYCSTELNPLIDALNCLCNNAGERCYESQQFSKYWWDTYWSTTLPAANLIIDQLAAKL